MTHMKRTAARQYGFLEAKDVMDAFVALLYELGSVSALCYLHHSELSLERQRPCRRTKEKGPTLSVEPYLVEATGIEPASEDLATCTSTGVDRLQESLPSADDHADVQASSCKFRRWPTNMTID